MIGIIGAMPEEVAAIKEKIKNCKEDVLSVFKFYEGTIYDKKVVLMQSGIGKVNAAVGTTLLFEHYDIDSVINIGTAGGVKSDCNVLDVIVSNRVAYHDVDVTAFHYDLGQVPGMPLFFIPDERLVSLSLDVLQNEGLPVHCGLIVSGDAFINEPEQIQTILNTFPDAAAVEMEASAISHVCMLFGKPFIILRSLSDIAGKKSNVSFDQYVEKASRNSAETVMKLIEKF